MSLVQCGLLNNYMVQRPPSTTTIPDWSLHKQKRKNCYQLPRSQVFLLIASVCVCQSLSCVQLFETPWTVAHQAPLFTGFSRQEYWSGWPFSGRSSAIQKTFPTQGLNPGLMHCRWILYCLSHKQSPLIASSIILIIEGGHRIVCNQRL